MSDRQYAELLTIRGLTSESHNGQVSRLRRLQLQDNGKGSYPRFDEKWFQDLLYNFPSLLPAGQIEPAFEALEPVARELPVAGKHADLLFVNPDGCIALVETKLWRNPEAKREVIAQLIDYACEMSGWSYVELVQAVKKANKSSEDDPLLSRMRRATQDTSFNENEFIEIVNRNLRKGYFLLLVVGDEVSDEAERMAEFIQRTPHLHFAVGLVELALFREKDEGVDPLFVQPRVVAKTQLQPRIVIDIALAEGLQMRAEVKTRSSATQPPRRTLTEEQFRNPKNPFNKKSPEAWQLAVWVLDHAAEHLLRADWGGAGFSLKYLDEASGAEFNFGQIRTKDGSLSTTYLLPKFMKLGLPTDIALAYLDEIIHLVPGSYRKEFGFDKELKTQVILYGSDDWLPFGYARSLVYGGEPLLLVARLVLRLLQTSCVHPRHPIDP